MDHHIDIPNCLRAFAIILEKGEKMEDGYHLEGITAESLDHGYTVVMRNRQCCLNIYFHNQFGLESPDQSETETFIRHLYRIAEQ